MVRAHHRSYSAQELWHHTLHPSILKSQSSNPLPRPLRALIHPTRATLSQDGETRKWRSRDHRKHRNVPLSPAPSNAEQNGRKRKSKNVIEGLIHMTRLEWWNISWWVAIAFTVGSIVWVLNGFGSFLPFILPDKYTKESNATFNGWTAWTGATIFEFGAILALWEAWNRDDEVHFGWGVKESVKAAFVPNSNSKTKAKDSVTSPSDEKEKPSTSSSKEQLTRPPTYADKELALETNHGVPPRRRWVWFSHDLKFFSELGFLAAFAQLCGASIFWISGFTALPQIQTAIEENTGLLDGVFWTPQVVGGSGFIISSLILMIESQHHWYIPAPLSLGWQIGVWNLIGGIGFTLCGALGYAGAANTRTGYESALATFWGSWAFLIGSVVQWYESVNSVE